jgi:16S rRNA (guanine527-N7)-methyltransferase
MADDRPRAGETAATAWQRSIARFGLDERQLGQLSAALTALARDEHAPTAVRDVAEAAKIHVADSLVGLEVAELRVARSVADLGSGAGFPGLALAIGLPDAVVCLVESQRRKCEFLRSLAAGAGVDNATVVCARAEEWSEGAAANDVVVARALASQSVVLEYAAPLLRLGGVVVDWRGRRSEVEEHDASAAAETLGLRLREIRRVEPFVDATDRHLHVFVKEHPTPARFPRRAGIARKRPLRG